MEQEGSRDLSLDTWNNYLCGLQSIITYLAEHKSLFYLILYQVTF